MFGDKKRLAELESQEDLKENPIDEMCLEKQTSERGYYYKE